MTKDQIELDIREQQIIQLTQDWECSQADLRAANSELVKAKVHISNILWGLSNISLAEVKFEKAKGKAWMFIRGEDK